jgi:hypothetical protein
MLLVDSLYACVQLIAILYRSQVCLIIVGFQEDLPPEDVATWGPRCKVTHRFNLAFEILPLVRGFRQLLNLFL